MTRLAPPSPRPLDYSRADWSGAFRNVLRELDGERLEPSSGSIPPEIEGCLYRNGPGRLERAGQWVHHPFDGDGMIAAVRFADGKARFSNRFVRTEGWQQEEQEGRFLYRGVFGTQKPGGWLANAFDLRMKNIANTHVVRLGDDLLALWEASSPHALDPGSLETRGVTLLDGVLQPGEAFSAHPRFDPGHHGARRMVTFGVQAGPRSRVRLMEFAVDGPDAGRLLAERSDSFPGFAFLHDFAITPNWAVFMQNAVAFNPLPYALGLKGAAQCLASKPGQPGQFWLIPRPGSPLADQAPRRLQAPEGFVFHHLNAFEEPDAGEAGTLVLDSIVYADFPSVGPGTDFRQVDFDSLPEGQLRRFRLDLASGEVCAEDLELRCCEFATVAPSRVGLQARHAWMAVAERERGNDPLQAIEKLDLVSGERRLWSAAPRGFVSEPVMVPAADAAAEDDGWVLVLIWNAARSASDLVILRAGDLSEQAVLPLPLAIPHGLHGSWVPGSL
ncbi:Apocarotenoid-15,15'-oxygenase [Synechococcus sp. RSCCF101]|uniref:carotenoid oxygenase family protein n=1 Tax=Synechococcus sp. RSCCF101 TaxID=2511069 RepID=UPI001245BD4E|nr:carotenoid oxygenase family protein [Synechococcus sp. RSCCF101]QEY32299.1 Apocarotenoid-15,15'-oxygenase [Synechococcus sp. RSCCF101]